MCWLDGFQAAFRIFLNSFFVFVLILFISWIFVIGCHVLSEGTFYQLFAAHYRTCTLYQVISYMWHDMSCHIVHCISVECWPAQFSVMVLFCCCSCYVDRSTGINNLKASSACIATIVVSPLRLVLLLLLLTKYWLKWCLIKLLQGHFT